MISKSDNDYVLGENQDEIDRLQMQHGWLKATIPELILAPIDRTRKHPTTQILDSGTADGIWLRDVSTQFASSPISCIGTDISPSLFPANHATGEIQYMAQSIKDPWPVEFEGRFDLVHQRLVLACCNPHEAEIAVANLASLGKPGGWIQLMECDHSGGFSPETAAAHPALAQFGRLVISHLDTKGQCGQQGLYLERYLKQAGLVNVTEKVFDIPVGRGAYKCELGDVAAQNIIQVAKKMGGDDKYVEQLAHELETIGGTQRFHVVFGQRPIDPL
uniref:PenN n=1 Tax=Penicillium steckii TaxID=303698 RepID=A0A7T1TTA7_9EURO|nr:PenN [Penicillium steckii]